MTLICPSASCVHLAIQRYPAPDHLHSPAHIEVIIGPAGTALATGGLPQGTRVVNEGTEEDGARYGAQETDHDPLEAQGEGPMRLRHTPATQ